MVLSRVAGEGVREGDGIAGMFTLATHLEPLDGISVSVECAMLWLISLQLPGQ